MKIIQPHRTGWAVVDDEGQQWGPFSDRDDAQKWIDGREAYNLLQQLETFVTAPALAPLEPVLPTNKKMRPRLLDGWLILKSDSKPWDEVLYPSYDVAEATASQCNVTGFAIVKARWAYDSARPKHPQLLFDKP